MEEEKKETGNVYELAYLFVPTIPEDKILGSFGDLKALVDGFGGIAIAEEMPRLITLAYEMSRIINNKKTYFDTGYFGWLKFELDPAQVAEINAKLSRDESIIRFMIISTTRENTIASKKPFVRGDFKKRPLDKPTAVADAPVLDKAELDKEIDALVDSEIAE